MNKQSETAAEAEARRKAEARTARILAVVFGLLMIVMIGGMLVFDMYTENLHGSTAKVRDAAEP
jgi:cell division septal protein FtsQ